MMEAGWYWKLPQLLSELGVSHLQFAQHTGIRRATIIDLRNATDTVAGTLVSVYNGIKPFWPRRRRRRALNLHDLIHVEGQPETIRVRSRQPLPDMRHMPNLPNVYLNTPALRRELVPKPGAPIPLNVLAASTNIALTNLSRLENGRIQPRVSTLIAIYRYCLTLNPRLTLHDVLLIVEPRSADKDQDKEIGDDTDEESVSQHNEG